MSHSILKRWIAGVDTGLLFTLFMCGFAIWPVLNHPGLFLGHDTLNHVFRVAELDRLWSQGILIPRWAETFYFGYGSPVFQYYAGLTYYLSGLFMRLFDLDALGSLRLLVILCLPMAGAGMYLFTRHDAGKLGGLLAALVYVYSPYIVFTQPVTRGAYPELLCCALFPWVMWRFNRLLAVNRPSNIAWASLSLALLLLSHNLLSIILSAFLLGWLIWCKLWRLIAWRGFGLSLIALLLSLGLTAFFWMPVLAGRADVHLTNIPENILSEHRNFFGFFVPISHLLAPSPLTDSGAANGILLRLNFGLAQWLLALTGLVGLVCLGWTHQKTIRLSRAVNMERETLEPNSSQPSVLSPQSFSALIPHTSYLIPFFTLCTFLILPLAAPLWTRIPALNYLEFPWRLLGPIAFYLAFLAAMNALWIDRLPLRLRYILTPLILALPVILALPTLYIPESRPKNMDTSQAAYLQSEITGRTSPGTSARNDFLPGAVLTLPGATQSLLDDYADGYPVDKANRAILPPDTTVTLLDHSPVSDSWHIAATAPFTLEILTFDFPGWTAHVDGQPVPITPSVPYGFITIPIPSSDHTLTLSLELTPVQTLGGALSLLSLSVLGLTLFIRPKPSSRATFSANDFSKSSDLSPQSSSLTSHTSHLIPFSLTLPLTLLLAGLFMREGIAWLNSPPGQALTAQHPSRYHLGQDIQLLGYNLSAGTAKPGDWLEVVLYWYAHDMPDDNYSSFVHLSVGSIPISQADKPYPAGRATREWLPGAYLRDSYNLQIPAGTPPGDYQLNIGLYTCSTRPPGECGNGDRLSVSDSDGSALGDLLPLAIVTVQ